MHDVSDAEIALIKFVRSCEAGHHQITVSCLGRRWCVEASDFTVNARLAVGYGQTFDEAWARVATKIKMSKNAVAGASDIRVGNGDRMI
ncbi:MAG: hypothetical protein WDN46_12515 [Methylocella sp.]